MYHRSTKNMVLKSITTIAVIIDLLSIMLLDSDSWIPVVAMAICTCWIFLFAIANTKE